MHSEYISTLNNNTSFIFALLTEFKNEIYRKKFKFGNKETLDKNGIVKEHKKFWKLNIQVICDTSSIQQSIF